MAAEARVPFFACRYLYFSKAFPYDTTTSARQILLNCLWGEDPHESDGSSRRLQIPLLVLYFWMKWTRLEGAGAGVLQA
jgi:hypothetical protein